jgi:hypothetical protein
MNGAAALFAALILAQAVSLPFPRNRWQVRGVAGVLLGAWVLAPSLGLLAVVYPLPPLALWIALYLMLQRARPRWTVTATAESIYVAVVAIWIAILDEGMRDAMWRALAATRNPAALGVAAVYLAGIFGGERIVRRVIAPFLQDLPPDDRTTLPRAGRVIGWAERFLVMTLIAGNYGEPVGWLLAAKTAMRYPEIKQEATGRLGEYFFVGTLLSISIGVGAGLAIRWLMAQPPV